MTEVPSNVALSLIALLTAAVMAFAVGGLLGFSLAGLLVGFGLTAAADHEK